MSWTVNRQDVEVTEWEYTTGQLKLTVRALANSTTLDEMRKLQDSAGKLDRVVNSDGTYQVFEQRFDAQEIRVEPPEQLRPILSIDDFYLRSYTESAVDSGSLRYDVSLTFWRTSTRGLQGTSGRRYGHFRYGDGESLTVEGSTDDWLLELKFGDIEMSNPTVGTLNDDEKQFSFTLVPAKAQVVIETLETLLAVDEITVPGGHDFYVDNTPNNRNTVTLHGPDDTDEYAVDGTYIVTDWSVESLAPRLFKCDLSVVLDEAFVTSGYGGQRYGNVRY